MSLVFVNMNIIP